VAPPRRPSDGPVDDATASTSSIEGDDRRERLVQGFAYSSAYCAFSLFS
jgi:hypothetical protein